MKKSVTEYLLTLPVNFLNLFTSGVHHKLQTACRETGHAFVGQKAGYHLPLEISVRPLHEIQFSDFAKHPFRYLNRAFNLAGACIYKLPENAKQDDTFLYTQIVMNHGGQVAQEYVFGPSLGSIYGAQNDFKDSLICAWKLVQSRQPDLPYRHFPREVYKVLSETRRHALEILEQNEAEFFRIAAIVDKEEVLDEARICAVFLNQPENTV